MRFSRILAVGVAVVLLAAAGARAQDVTLSVAVSLKGVTEELGRSFMAAHPGVTLRYNFGASGDLQKQIEAGAPIDVFLSAAQRQMDELEKQSLIVAVSRRAFARNVLIVIKPADSKIDIAKPADLLDARVGRIAIGSPKTVPAGQYAEESLRALGLWDRLQPKLVFAENVRQALDYVARGEVDAGFVYTTDAATATQGVKDAFRPPEDSYRPIVYPGAVVAAAKQPALGQAFLDLLGSAQGRAVLGRFGFQPPRPAPADLGEARSLSTEAPIAISPGGRWIGAQRDVFGGDLRGHAELEALAAVPHLYALGPLEGLRGEVSIFRSVFSVARIEREGVVTASRWHTRACFLVWAQVPVWSERVRASIPPGLDSIATHDPDHAFLCAHRVALLHEGRLARLGPPDEVITRESLREVYGVEVTVTEVCAADGRMARVCIPVLGAPARRLRPGLREDRS